MKVKEILTEMPYHHEGEMKKPPFGTTFVSDSALARLYEQLSEIIIGRTTVKFFTRKTTGSVIGVVAGKKPGSNEDTNLMVFDLKFKSSNTLVKAPDTIKSKKVLQVDKVASDDDFESKGVASFVYATLARLGNVVVSDTSQFTDGKMLWKKMAREAKVKDYDVFILDDEHGFKKNGAGELVHYDSKNIDDAELWTTGLDFSGEHVLFAMISK